MKSSVEFTKTENYIKGDTTQKFVDNLFKSRGFYTLPSYGYAEGEKQAPKVFATKRRSLVLPDLDVMNNGKRIYVEVKFKGTNSTDPKTGISTQGIDQENYIDYLDIRDASGTPVWIVIIQGDTNEIMYQRIDILDEHADFFNKKVKAFKYRTMVFFPKGIFIINSLANPDYLDNMIKTLFQN
jgi:hypothetical protein